MGFTVANARVDRPPRTCVCPHSERVNVADPLYLVTGDQNDTVDSLRLTFPSVRSQHRADRRDVYARLRISMFGIFQFSTAGEFSYDFDELI